MPILSICIPVKNAHDRAMETYISVQSMLGDRLQIVFQDCNGDSHLNIKDQDVIVSCEGDTGTSNAVNKILPLCTGEYILFWGAGEVAIQPGFMNALNDLGEYDIYFNQIVAAQHLCKPSPELFQTSMACLTPGAMIRRSLIDRLDERYEIANDYDMFCTLLKKTSNYIVTNHAIVNFTLDGISSRSRAYEGLLESEIIRLRQFNKIPILSALDTANISTSYVRSCINIV